MIFLPLIEYFTVNPMCEAREIHQTFNLSLYIPKFQN